MSNYSLPNSYRKDNSEKLGQVYNVDLSLLNFHIYRWFEWYLSACGVGACIFLHYLEILITFSLWSHQRFHLCCILFSCHQLQHVFFALNASAILWIPLQLVRCLDLILILSLYYSMGILQMIFVWCLCCFWCYPFRKPIKLSYWNINFVPVRSRFLCRCFRFTFYYWKSTTILLLICFVVALNPFSCNCCTLPRFLAVLPLRWYNECLTLYNSSKLHQILINASNSSSNQNYTS